VIDGSLSKCCAHAGVDAALTAVVYVVKIAALRLS
jgi:hypothetical protein